MVILLVSARFSPDDTDGECLMEIVVVGAGEVGSTVAASLADAHEIVVVDRDPERVETVTYEYDVLAIEGDGTSLDTLREAGIETADLFIASTDSDEANMVACATSKTVSDAFTIARVRKTGFLRTWEGAEGAFGVDFMVGTDLLAAETIDRIASLPGALDVDAFSDGRVQMAEFEIPASSDLVGQTVAKADRFESLTFAAIFRNGDVEIPGGDTVIEAADRVVVIGSPKSCRGFATALSPTDGLDHAEEVFIVGGGEIGYQTACRLEDRGLTPRVIEFDPERARELAEDLEDSIVLEHDATDVAFLEREHVADADLVVAALESDEKNLLVSLLAKQLGTDRTVAIVENGAYVDLFERVGVDVAVNPREVTAEEITRFTLAEHTENVAILESDRAEVLEIEIGAESALLDRTIMDATAELPEGVVIGAITRGDTLITPRGSTVIERGDHVVAFMDSEILDDVAPRL
jgi:trk system potassium uptake protein TrkA